jgi:hypothetical protein
MIYMTAEQAEDMGILDHEIRAHVVILSEADMQERLRTLFT